MRFAAFLHSLPIQQETDMYLLVGYMAQSKYLKATGASFKMLL